MPELGCLIRLRWRLLGILLISFNGCSKSLPPSGDPSGSVCRYAADSFVAGVRIHPKPLIAHPLLGTLPIEAVLPPSLTLGKLARLNIEELAVFSGPSAAKDQLAWGAAARFAEPIELADLIQQWRQSASLAEEEFDPPITLMSLGDTTCFRIPGGTLLPPPRKYGTLRFIDRMGEPAVFGINVGAMHDLRYVEGGTKSAGIFTFGGVTADDLDKSQLPLELCAAVFRTYDLGVEWTEWQLILRNPETKRESAPIPFRGISHVPMRLDIPRKLRAADSEEIDLFDDLIIDGRLEVVLKGEMERIYLGFESQGLTIRPAASEYVAIVGDEVVVATSTSLLKEMLSAADQPVSLARQLAQRSSNLTIAVNARDDAERRAWRQVIDNTFPIAGESPWGEKLQHATATLAAGQPARLEISATFRNYLDAQNVQNSLVQRIDEVRSNAAEELEQEIGRFDALGSLLSFNFGGPGITSLPPDSLSYRERAKLLAAMTDDALANILIARHGNQLSIHFHEPDRLLDLSEAEELALAHIEMHQGFDLCNWIEFTQGDEKQKRATERLPQQTHLWVRRAHQLAYNNSREFDGYKTRYAWVRRGIEVLLDGRQHNPDNVDLTWMLAYFIGNKIGDSQEHVAYRKLFAEDHELHQRLSQYVDLAQAKSPNQVVDNWLVAKMLIDTAQQRQLAPTAVSPIRYDAAPAQYQARYAHALTESGHWKEAQAAWREAERLYRELGDRPFQAGAERVRLSEPLENPDLLKIDPQLHAVRLAIAHVDFQHWLNRCQLEQTPAIENVWKLAAQAEEKQATDPAEACELSRQSLKALAQALDEAPEKLSLILGDFVPITRSYERLAERQGEEIDPSLVPLLEKISFQAQRVHFP